ncbi:hypothetical protein [Paenibacillus apiarius]|uniref:Uncharacterized protein n=1 Tax=Paenibacillus apiarius TaxID=46240 RepID=A0ABT4E1H1_9BACL|nr:hypothetical protein [Paenibacillus apiarius]MCY9517749.1 hypothetical protein [Paenibacillus apiarius]MCY9523465.1 hypothetical protein [Paenibacillus apiarius]MCY9561543.1 hypothetical protein [Paenibacillus apiarius]MCY9682217.1 hypothetical protein [Paenibacillus apiarius]MCY9726308.1 hypothetical protein [Paenibacillus apiarius]
MIWKIKNTVAMKIKSSTKLQIRRVYWPSETLQGSEHLYCFFLSDAGGEWSKELGEDILLLRNQARRYAAKKK